MGGISLAKALVKPLMKAVGKALRKALCHVHTHISVFHPTDMGDTLLAKAY